MNLSNLEIVGGDGKDNGSEELVKSARRSWRNARGRGKSRRRVGRGGEIQAEREEIHARSVMKYRQGVGRNTDKEREEILGNSRWKCRQAVWEI